MAEYWFKRTSSGAVEGPCTAAQLRTLAAKGIIISESLVSVDQQRWYPATKVKGLLDTPAAGSAAVAHVQSPSAPAEADQPSAQPPTVAPPPPPPQAILLPRRPAPQPVRVEPPGEANPLLVWPSALLAPALLAWTTAAAWEAGQQQYAGMGPKMIALWSAVGVLIALCVVIGVFWKHALAYRAGVVIGPIGGGFILLSSLGAAGDLTALAWAAVLCAVALSAVTPFLWTRPGAKRYFGLCCPQCNSVRVGAESFAFFERRCSNCGTVFNGDGAVLRLGPAAPQAAPTRSGAPPGAAPPPTRQPVPGTGRVPAPAVGVPVSPGVQAPITAPQPRGTLAYATSVYQGAVGTPGRDRDLTWFLVLSCIVLLLGAIVLGLAFGSGYQYATTPRFGPTPAPSGLEAASTAVNCFGSAAALGLVIYWLVWVYQVHKEMRDYTGYAYHVSPGKALGFCFIPFFNLYWCVYMPYELAKAVQAYLQEYAGARRDAVSPSAVLTFQILAIVPGSCVQGLALLFYALAMRSIQNGLNELWAHARRDLSASPGYAPA